MHESLQEYCDSRGVTVRVDREHGVIRGVKVLGLESKNGRSYLSEALAQAVPLYEGAKVHVNHAKGSPLATRDYQDRIGIIRQVSLREGEGLFADLHYNPKHALADQLAWDAEHAPENVGLSHNVQARVARRGETIVVEAITAVQSVDLVADPATTRGLFEELDPNATDTARIDFDALTLAELELKRADLVEQITARQADQLNELRAEVERLEQREVAREREAAIGALLAENGLPALASSNPHDRLVLSETFLASLRSAPDATTLRRLVEERAQLIRSATRWSTRGPTADTRPVAREQYAGVPLDVGDARGFARAITR